jgi:hypothetical protein
VSSPPTTTGFLPIWSSPTPSERREVVTLDREGVPTVTDSTASTRDRYHEKAGAAVCPPRPASGRAFSWFAADSTGPAYSPRKLTLPGLTPGGRCKVVGEVPQRMAACSIILCIYLGQKAARTPKERKLLPRDASGPTWVILAQWYQCGINCALAPSCSPPLVRALSLSLRWKREPTSGLEPLT